MEVFSSMWVVGMTAIFFIPFAIAGFYFLVGFRSFLTGKKENNKVKKIGGYNAMFGALMAMVALFFFWKILVWDSITYGE